jgi:ribosomal protein L11 methyltransferase
MKKIYYQITIYIAESMFESLSIFMQNFNISGIVEENDSVKAYFKESDWNENIREDIEAHLNEYRKEMDFGDYEIIIDTIEEENWNKEWEESIEPIEVSKRIIIKPTWKEIGKIPGQIVIQIDPKMSFGTGHHETTRLCINALEKHLQKDNTILDMGTGTGVIAIAAILLGAKNAFGIDNDEWCYENANENLNINNVTDKIRIILGDQKSIPDQKFDIITSNIDYNTNSELIAIYPKHLNEKGLIILSGLLIDDLDNMKQKIQSNGLKVIDETSENEWGCLVLSDEHLAVSS